MRLRVRTVVPSNRPGAFPRGQDTVVEVVDEQGNAKMVEGIKSVMVRVSARQDHVEILLEGAVTLDVEGVHLDE